MSLMPFLKRKAPPVADDAVASLLRDYSIEVMPRTAAKVADFTQLLPAGTRVYVAHIDGTPIDEMVATAARLTRDGFQVMPHIPARLVRDRATLTDWIARYRGEAGVDQALLLAGGVSAPQGDYENAMQLLDSGAFGDFKRLHVAGHPEGNRDIDPDGSDTNVSAALRWKQRFSDTTDAQMALVTQFCFEADPIIAWADALREAGITLPIHIGIAGPAKLQTMIKFAMACGVGPSLRVLQRRAMDVTKLLLPYAPDDVVGALAARKAADPAFNVTHVHLFPLGGIAPATTWAMEHGGDTARPSNPQKDPA